MNESRDGALCMRGIYVTNAKYVAGDWRVPRTTNQRHDELIHTNQSNVTERATEFLRVTKNGCLSRQFTGCAGQVVPATHDLAAIHVNERIGYTQIVSDQLLKKIIVSNSEATLVQVMNMHVS